MQSLHVLVIAEDAYLQGNDDMRGCQDRVDNSVRHGSMAAQALDGDLELLAGAHERPGAACQRARRDEGPHM